MTGSAEKDVCDGCQKRPCVCETVVLPNAEKEGLVWTCCDPNGVTFCVGCGEDVQRGRTLPHRVLPPADGGTDG